MIFGDRSSFNYPFFEPLHGRSRSIDLSHECLERSIDGTIYVALEISLSIYACMHIC